MFKFQLRQIKQRVIPAEAGIQFVNLFPDEKFTTWTPASAGVTTLGCNKSLNI